AGGRGWGGGWAPWAGGAGGRCSSGSQARPGRGAPRRCVISDCGPAAAESACRRSGAFWSMPRMLPDERAFVRETYRNFSGPVLTLPEKAFCCQSREMWSLDRKRLAAEVCKNDVNLAAVIGIDRARRIEHRDA